ncbi:hypothetical protein [Nostoc favosum]|uniref:Uncharacterized protein n=1 Tax=Nostoc favosum CHAB5714 TaxID=2780399 RepID=A0ABS8IFJ7_9NOSO|nr:hypothetical protein [Nostoc favosum]MCC5602982.1 hypothetical protein [Nostoc favosum CHAB5714]
MTNAPCPMPHAPCPMPHAPCPMPHAPCPILSSDSLLRHCSSDRSDIAKLAKEIKIKAS